MSTKCHVRSGHQARSSDPTTKQLSNRAAATMFQGKLWNFRNMMRSNVYLGFLYRWPQVRSFLWPPKSQVNGQKINSVIFTVAKAYLSGIISYRTIVDNSSKNLHCLPIERSFEVTRGHQLSFANNFWSKRDTYVELVSVRSSWPDESTDVQYDPFRLSRDLGLTWPEVKLWPWPFKVILYIVRRALTRQTRWYQIRCSTFKMKDFVVEKPLWKILEFWPLVTSIFTWAKNYRNDFEVIYRKLSNAAFCFSLRRPGAEIMGGGGRSNAPPPSRWWKIQRPSRARFKHAIKNRFRTLVYSNRFIDCHIVAYFFLKF